MEIPSKQWVRPLAGFGWSHPLALREELQPQAKAHFFSDKKMHFERAETQGDMSRGTLESRGGAHNKQNPALDTDHPGSPRMPALASKLSVKHSMCMKPSFLPFPQPSARNKPKHTTEQLFGKALLRCCRAGHGPAPILIHFIHKTRIYLMQFFGTLSNTAQNYISVIRGKD